MKIIADKNIPFLKGIVEAYGNVEYLSGKEFTKEAIKNADTLIIRTVTYLGKELLEGSNVKLICSATIGYDHIDTDYCDKHGITWTNAPGCNSGSVQQYIASALIVIAKKKEFSLKNKTIGIIGVGNVGKKVASICELLGMRILKNDPLREIIEGSTEFTDIDTIKNEADIITFHTPLTKNGDYPTYHLGNKKFFSDLKKKPIIINSARGSIIDTLSIKEAIKNKQISGTVIDCWENEPNIDEEYLELVDIATPHIAGYSADGKANATRIALESVANYWNLSKKIIKNITLPLIDNNVIEVNKSTNNYSFEDLLLKTYNPMTDCSKLINNPADFSKLRETYPLRREYPAYIVKGEIDEKIVEKLKLAGFIIA